MNKKTKHLHVVLAGENRHSQSSVFCRCKDEWLSPEQIRGLVSKTCHIYGKEMPELIISDSNDPKTFRRHGTYSWTANRLVIHVRTKWTVLHELAHLVAERPQRVNGRWNKHGKAFGVAWQQLHDIWR